MGKKLILCVGDLHAPFVNLDAVKTVLHFIKYHKPSHIIQLGDLYDFYSFTRFDRTHNLLTPQQEFIEGRKFAEDFWYQCRLRSKNSICYQLLGNHDIRLRKQVMKKMPELESFVNFEQMHQFPKVNTINDHREELILKTFGYPIMFHHGFFLRCGQHMNRNKMCTVFGHTHRGWTHYDNLLDANGLWELNAGFLADVNALPLSYTNQRRITKTTLGFGVIDRYGPRFIQI